MKEWIVQFQYTSRVGPDQTWHTYEPFKTMRVRMGLEEVIAWYVRKVIMLEDEDMMRNRLYNTATGEEIPGEAIRQA